MADYQFIQIEEEEEFEDEAEEEDFEDEIEEEEFEDEIEEEEDFEDEIEEEEEFEDEIEEEEEFEDEVEEEDEDREFEENLIPERIILPVNSNLINELEDDDDDSDYDEEEDDGEYLIPERIILPVNIDLINRLEDDDSDYDDDDDDDEDYEDDEDYQDDGDYQEEEVEELIPVEITSPGRVVSSSIFRDRSVVMNNVCLDNSNDFDGRNEEVNRCEIDGLICPICFEAWTSGGDHQISCLPCGHLYGLSCINKWLQQRRSSGKCPQCNSLCTLKDVRVLYASRLCVADEELHKRVRSLEAKCAYLEKKAVLLTHDELIKQIRNNPTLVERLSTAIADLNQQQVFP